MRDKVINLHL